MRYAYEQVKVAKHYGERDDLQAFLTKCNENNWHIEKVLDVSQGFFVFIYTIPDENPG